MDKVWYSEGGNPVCGSCLDCLTWNETEKKNRKRKCKRKKKKNAFDDLIYVYFERK